jgi:hypothetical protein
LIEIDIKEHDHLITKPKKKRRKTGRFGDCSLNAMLAGIPKVAAEQEVD